MQAKGFYLYAVRPASNIDNLPEMKGIDKSGKVFAIRIGNKIEAVTSLVSLKEFGSKEIRERAQNDLRWIKEKSLLHNQVVARSLNGADGAVVPMKFGSIFRSRAALAKRLAKDSEKFLQLLQKLKGKEEWSLKVFAERKVFEREIMKNDETLRGRKNEISLLSKGRAYFKEKEFAEELEKKKLAEYQIWRDKLCEILPLLADEVCLGKILGKELTLREEPMILNAALLFDKKKLNKFSKDIEKWRVRLRGKGLLIETSGPWPPYCFIE